jgi:hypothetical protein
MKINFSLCRRRVADGRRHERAPRSSNLLAAPVQLNFLPEDPRGAYGTIALGDEKRGSDGAAPRVRKAAFLFVSRGTMLAIAAMAAIHVGFFLAAMLLRSIAEKIMN